MTAFPRPCLTGSGRHPDRRGGDQHQQMMTVHSAKGLEFDYVFITGWKACSRTITR